jgi:hypothetical protein
MSLHTAIVPPQGVWWKPAGKQEKVWIIIAFIWCMVLFAAMPFWHIKGGQNPSGIRSKVEPKAFAERVQRFITDYQVGEEGGHAAELGCGQRAVEILGFALIAQAGQQHGVAAL